MKKTVLFLAFGKEQKAEVKLEGMKKPDAKARLTVLKSNNLEAVNSLEAPSVIAPVETTIDVKGKVIGLILAPYSFSLVRVKLL